MPPCKSFTISANCVVRTVGMNQRFARAAREGRSGETGPARHAGFYGPAGSSGFLDSQGAQVSVRFKTLPGQPVRDLVGLAAQTYDQDGRKIRMPGVAGHGPLEDGSVRAQG